MSTIRATIMQTPRPGELDVLTDQLITVDGGGTITSIEPAEDSDQQAADVTLDGHVLFPGLVDTHFHAPQWPQLGTGLDLPLERWLFEYTFPVEARCADVEVATHVWDDLVPGLLRRGTTTAVYYASIHEPATLALAEACVRHGQRAFVGRVAMDHPEGTPEWYRDASPTDAVDASNRSIEAIRALPGSAGLVEPIITPRFIPACTDATLTGLGELADATGALVQTHCSEGTWEHDYVLERHGVTDAHSLDRFGLVRDHTVLAHATHLGDDDRTLLVERGAGVAHCPLSNAYFSDRVFPARRHLEHGLRIGLGTDVAGGSTASMTAQCAHAVTASRRLADAREHPGAHDRIDIATAFWLATRGGAELLGIPVGLIEPGRRFDAFAVDIGRANGVGVDPSVDDDERVFEKVLRLATSSDIDHVWVNGRNVNPPSRGH